MKKSTVITCIVGAAAIGAIGAIAYCAKKIHDLNKSVIFDENAELFECDEKLSPNEQNIFYTKEARRAKLKSSLERVKAQTKANADMEKLKTEESEEENKEVSIPPEVINKIGKLEDLLTFEGLEFDENQAEYLNYVCDYMRTNPTEEMRTAVLIGMLHNGKNPLEVFTDNQFAEIKKIIG